MSEFDEKYANIIKCKYGPTCHIKVSFPEECRNYIDHPLDCPFYQQWEETPEGSHVLRNKKGIEKLARGWKV